MNPLRRRDPNGRRGVRRAVVLMPNGLTLFNLFCGIYAIILALHKDIAAAPGFIVLGGIADALDGRVARATGTGSRFGEELDSLVDAISFGFAPALIVYLGKPLETQGNLDWLLVFIFAACAVMRLARFNVEQAGRKKTHFHGLPSPAAGLTLATYYWFAQTPLYNETVILFTNSTTLAQLPWHNLLRGLTAVLAALMISDVPYPAMPSIGFNSVKKILGTLMIAGALVLLLVRREEFIFPALLAYVIYGIVKWMLIGLLGRASTPDEIYWEREAELHQEDERRSAFDRPHLSKEVLEDLDDDDAEEAPARAPRERGNRREERERRPKRRDGERRERPPRDEARRDEGARQDEPRREDPKREERKRDEPRRERPRREPAPQAAPQTQPAADPAHPVIAEAPSVFAADANGDEQTSAGGEARSDEEVRARKRRRRRGRGGRSRGERSSEGGSDAAAGGDSESSDFSASNEQPGAFDRGDDDRPRDRGDAPPGPSLPDTPTPSGPAE